MLLFPFLGLVVSLTLWGTFYPVPFTDVRPHGPFMGRITGAIKASFLLTGTYEFILTAGSKATGALQHESFSSSSGAPGFPIDTYLDDMSCNSSSWAFTTATLSNPCLSRDMYSSNSSEIALVTEPLETPHVATSGIEKAHTTQSAQSSTFLLELALGSLVTVLVCWLSLRLMNNAYTLKDLALSLGRLFVPSPEVANHLVMTSGLTVTVNSSNDVVLLPTPEACGSVMAMAESALGMGQSGVNPIYSMENRSFFTGSVATCDAWLSTPALVTGSQLVDFHPVVDAVINRLERLQVGAPVNWSDCMAADSDATPVGKVNNEPGSTSESSVTFAPVRMPQLTALVLRRFENISHFVLLRLVFVIVAAVGDGQTVAENTSSPDKEEGPPQRPKKNRMGQRQRRRIYQREMRKQQAELIERLDAGTDDGSNPSPQTPPGPVPASSAGHVVPSTVAPMVPSRPAMPVNPQGQGNGFRPPHPHPPPPHWQFPVVARQPPFPGQGGPVTPYPWQYQQYGYPHAFNFR
ncbi:hypothetical protein BDBG_04939 [Blastomyces gilchristii SLH14081]|uniref:Uncharacterized protein n=1 Tax=Blastomyces gilchristii (strain SLH14081) TaxID=559298 RepID=A0A179ULD6_BLAGS|nr:uncharacterized protein BDBG_04939 [Blastomyces gilchristii SLH14081]OAT08700.1 hypothetical protein BDBG_04939 [Blastomyces gilchristii SLH14081]